MHLEMQKCCDNLEALLCPASASTALTCLEDGVRPCAGHAGGLPRSLQTPDLVEWVSIRIEEHECQYWLQPQSVCGEGECSAHH